MNILKFIGIFLIVMIALIFIKLFIMLIALVFFFAKFILIGLFIALLIYLAVSNSKPKKDDEQV